MNKVTLQTTKNNNVAVYLYDDVQAPKAVIQIVHGAAEHFTRYEDFIKFLNSNGYICVGGDILGHGDSSHAEGNYVHFEEKEAYESITIVKDYIIDHYKNLPLYLLGHSMGSFIARRLLIDYPQDYSKAIISGTTTMSIFMTTAAKALGGITRIFRGPKGISPLLGNLTLDGFPVKMKKDGKLNDGEMWITHREDIAKYYQESPICGEPFTVAANQGMLYWVDFVSKINNVKKGDKSTPLLFISGSDDPLSNYGKDIKTTVEMYKKAEYQFIESLIYENMRHEVLNEIDNNKVYKDCLNFFNR